MLVCLLHIKERLGQQYVIVKFGVKTSTSDCCSQYSGRWYGRTNQMPSPNNISKSFSVISQLGRICCCFEVGGVPSVSFINVLLRRIGCSLFLAWSVQFCKWWVVSGGLYWCWWCLFVLFFCSCVPTSSPRVCSPITLLLRAVVLLLGVVDFIVFICASFPKSRCICRRGIGFRRSRFRAPLKAVFSLLLRNVGSLMRLRTM